MTVTQGGLRKITISLPGALVEFADELAQANGSNRSQVIAQMLEQARLHRLNELAAEGYRFYAAEAAEFAEASAIATGEVWLRNPDDEWE